MEAALPPGPYERCHLRLLRRIGWRNTGKGAVAVGERLESLETEPFAAEREWTVEGVPVLSAAAQVPEPAEIGRAHV